MMFVGNGRVHHFDMGMQMQTTVVHRFLKFIFLQLRSVSIICVALPLSFFYDIFIAARSKIVYTLGTAPLAHARKVAAIQRQVRDWADSGRKTKMCPVQHELSLWQHCEAGMTLIKTGPLTDILEVRLETPSIRVEPMVSIGELTKILIPLGYCLPIVPGKTDLTVQDAINGCGVDTSGRKYGMFQHICLSYEMVMPDGSLVIASKEKGEGAETQALFYGIPWSEGTLGILVAVTLRVIPIKSFIKLTYMPVHSTEEMQSKLTDESQCRENECVEGLMFSNSTGVVLRGRFSEGPPRNWGTVNAIGKWFKGSFYQHVHRILATTNFKTEFTEFVPLTDFYFRHSKSLYWQLKDYVPYSENILFRWFFGWMCPPRLALVEKLTPGMLRSRLNDIHVRRDLLIPMDHLAEALRVCHREFGIFPLWLAPYNQPSCPGMIRQRSGRNVLFVNVGVYGVPQRSHFNPKESVRRLESFARSVNGVTVVHNGTEMSRSEFWQMFDSSLYEWLRVKYNCKEAFLDVYDKVQSNTHS